MPGVFEAAKQMIEEHGYAFLSEPLFGLHSIFDFAVKNGYGFSMEPLAKRRRGVEHPLVCKITQSEILSEYVARDREQRAEIERLTLALRSASINAERYLMARPILSGDDTPEADALTLAIGGWLLTNKPIDQVLDELIALRKKASGS